MINFVPSSCCIAFKTRTQTGNPYLIRALAHFEEYSASCSVENWQDAAVHACIYAYTGQARWLMEKALSAALEDRGEELAGALRSQLMASNAA